MHLVPVETVVAAVRFAMVSGRAPSDGLYLVAADDASENNFEDVERIVRDGLAIRARPFPSLRLPSGLLTLMLRLSGRLSMDAHARLSTARLAGAGFRPPVTLGEALVRYARIARAEAGRAPAILP